MTKFVITGKNHNGELVYCAGIRSDYQVDWTVDPSKAVVLIDQSLPSMRRYLKRVHTCTEHYNNGDTYVSNVHLFDVLKPQCQYRACYGSPKQHIDLGIFSSANLAARHIAVDCKTRYPKTDWFMYKQKAKWGTPRFLPHKYSLINTKTGVYDDRFYFIEEIPL